MVFSENSTINDLINNESAKAILEKYKPGFTTNTMLLSFGKMFTLKQVADFPPIGITEEMLNSILNELKNIKD